MSLIDKIEEYFVKRNLKKRLIKAIGSESEIEFKKVLNTLRENKVMVVTKKDGVWIRLAGSGDDMINSDEFVKVVDFRNNKLNKLGL